MVDITILSIVTASLGVFILIVGFLYARREVKVQDVGYNGTEVFQTENEYIDFKKQLANPIYHIYSIQSLSSQPPIIVRFSLGTHNKNTFAFGKRQETSFWGNCDLAVVQNCMD